MRTGAKAYKSCRSRQELSNEYLVFACKIRLRYSRERASQSLPKLIFSQTLEKKVRTNIGNLLSGARDRDVEGGDGREPRPDQVDRADQPAHGRRHGHGAEEPEGKTNMKYH